MAEIGVFDQLMRVVLGERNQSGGALRLGGVDLGGGDTSPRWWRC